MLNHYHTVTLRVKGSGSLISTLYSLENEYSQNLKNQVLSLTSGRSPTLLANFIHEKAYLHVRVSTIDHKFEISNIEIGVKPVATGYPQ